MRTIAQLQKDVDTWIKKFGVRYFDEMTNLALLMEEVGELSRLVARNSGEQSFKPGKEPEHIKHSIANEMADVLFVLTCLANQMDIDLEQAIHQNFEKKSHRDSTRHHENQKLYQPPDK